MSTDRPPPALASAPLAALLTLPPTDVVAALPAFLPTFLASYLDEGPAVERVHEEVGRVLSMASDDSLEAMLDALRVRGETYAVYPPAPLAGLLSEAFLDPLLDRASTVDGLEHFDRAVAAARRGRRVLLVGNHLSYADTATLWVLLRRVRRAEAADRLAVLAGPKVFADAFRRLASGAVTAVHVAQSVRLAGNAAGLSAREVARIARGSLAQVESLLDDGVPVLVYPEGTRSRSGRLQPFLRAAGRYLELADLVLPMGQTGTDSLMPVGEADRFRPATVGVRFGRPIETDREGGREGREALVADAQAAVAALLPESMGPEEDAPRLR